MISVVALERWWRRPGKHPLIILLLEQSGGHRRARTDRLGIGNPTLHPVGLQPLLGQEEVWRGGNLVVTRIAGGVALQTRRGGAREQAACHVVFFGREHRHLLWD